ncbi:hypothetical protein C8R42DRAFT_665578, partial [Lentinula raphanica]
MSIHRMSSNRCSVSVEYSIRCWNTHIGVEHRMLKLERGVLSLPPVVAPTKVLIVPLSAKEELIHWCRKFVSHLFLRACSVIVTRSSL